MILKPHQPLTSLLHTIGNKHLVEEEHYNKELRNVNLVYKQFVGCKTTIL
jgi:hypothetical protein